MNRKKSPLDHAMRMYGYLIVQNPALWLRNMSITSYELAHYPDLQRALTPAGLIVGNFDNRQQVAA